MMETTSIYQDMAQRTGGSVYIGVVGPVRTGKSTFVKRFMETLVLPHIENSYRRDRAQDELPQSGSGRTIMTAEPKFVPEEAVELIGHAVGGVCPFAVKPGVKTCLDVSLQRFTTVFPACGSSNSAIELTCEELYELSEALAWVDVCKGWQDAE